MKTINLKVIRDLKRMKSQAITVALIVTCGVTVLVSAWSAYLSLQEARDGFYKEYHFADVFAEFKRAPNDVSVRLEKIKGLKTIETRIIANGLIDVQGQAEPALGTFVSLPDLPAPDSKNTLNTLYLHQGRMPLPGRDIEAVVHVAFAQAHHLKPFDSLNVTINGLQRKVVIVGIGISPEYVYALNPAAPLPDDLHFGVFWVRRQSLEELNNMNGSFNAVTAVKETNASTGDILAALDDTLKPYGNLGAYARNRQASNMMVSDEISQQKVMATVVPFIFLLISAFLVQIIVSRLISLQRAQIATLKACGYENKNVALHYLKTVGIMMAGGSLLGVLLGLFLGRAETTLYKEFFRFPVFRFVISPTAILVGFGAGIIPGLLGGLGSVRSVFKMPPAEAMRPPSPPIMTRGFLETLEIKRHLSIMGLMSLRSFLLKPWRVSLTIFGMATALALIIASSFWRDTIFHIFDTQFQIAQREDMTVTFVAPLPLEALHQIRELKGVLEVEGYRIVPVRFTYLNHKREIAIQGWPGDSQLRKLVSTRGDFISVPRQGLLASRSFQKWWGLPLNASVSLDVLEGKQKHLELPISGFTDDLIGNSTYMNVKDLWRILGETESYNSAGIRIDPNHREDIYAKLKSFPQVASVTVKTLLYESFKKSMAGVALAFTYVLISFAVTIAVGIIYNSARVSYSERTWELASLRVLGFEQPAINGLILGEIALQVLVSMPVGCLLGTWLSALSLKLIHTETFMFPLVIRGSTYAMSLAVITAAFGLSCIVIVRMVSKTKLVEALKMAE